MCLRAMGATVCYAQIPSKEAVKSWLIAWYFHGGGMQTIELGIATNRLGTVSVSSALFSIYLFLLVMTIHFHWKLVDYVFNKIQFVLKFQKDVHRWLCLVCPTDPFNFTVKRFVTWFSLQSVTSKIKLSVGHTKQRQQVPYGPLHEHLSNIKFRVWVSRPV